MRLLSTHNLIYGVIATISTAFVSLMLWKSPLCEGLLCPTPKTLIPSSDALNAITYQLNDQ